jgi:hypothetical protein
MMEWTQSQDLQLTEMHRKRLSVRFIADWMRWPAPAVRLRLVELGLTQPLSARGASVVSRATQSPMTHHMQVPVSDDRDEDDELRELPGCPRGHLLPEAKIAALYSGTGQDYR